MIPALVFSVFWLLLGFIGSGFAYSDHQFSYREIADSDRREQVGMALLLGLFGPVGLLICFLLSGFGRFGWWQSNRRPKS